MKVALGMDGKQDSEQSCQVGMGPRFDVVTHKMMTMMMMRRRKFVLYGMYIASPYMITEGQWRAVIRQIPDFLSK